MVKKRAIKIITEILDLKDVKVISQRIHDGIGIILQTESVKSYSVCPHCGTKSEKLHHEWANTRNNQGSTDWMGL